MFVEPEFSQTIPLKERRNLVGFIGRVSLEKGILPFVRAIPAVITALPDTEFLIIGSGRVDELLQDELVALKLAEKVAWLRWVDRGEVGRRLNQLKLLVVPSSTEGLPYIILEAAACGTPVLATGVGGIPDLIAHGKTGFLLPNNSSEAIARGIQSALSSDRLAIIAEQARRMAEDEYSFQACVRRYRSIFLDRE
ncbi:MAG: hypothetical protein A3K46_04875 [Chloroflexi bacterium RBG_13_60_9]|nr:MAG: hypothetical protein A3K46_04875 [Chloroflexi bacterium RBG_13_60_9]